MQPPSHAARAADHDSSATGPAPRSPDTRSWPPRLSPVAAAGAALLIAAGAAGAQEVEGAPGFREVLGLSEVDDAAISPSGLAVAYQVESTDWEENRFDSEIWLYRRGSPTVQLTRTEEGSSRDARWSPDGRWIAFLADRGGDGAPQLFAIRPDGGEAQRLTAVEEGVEAYRWGPYGLRLAVALREPVSERVEKREERYGSWHAEDEEYRTTHLWRLDLRQALRAGDGVSRPPDSAAAARPVAGSGGGVGDAPLRRLTGGEGFTVGGFAFGPRGERLAFDHRPEPSVTSYAGQDLSLLDLESGELRTLVDRPGADGDPVWSPDGEWLLFTTDDGDTAYYENPELARVPADGGDPEILTGGFDGVPSSVDWLPEGEGIRFTAWDRTRRKLYRLDPSTGEIDAVADSPRVVRSASYSRDGERVAFVGEAPRRMPEVYRTETGTWDPSALTSMTGQVKGWPVGRQEVVSWESEDGTTVEGVVIYPPNFDRTRRHPLVVKIHGGPSSIDYPTLANQYDSYVYPVTQWLARGAVVLMPNYRGSVGYGQDFRRLNVRNLGVGDRWDVMSGVDHLIEEGVAHPDSLVAMGWSQGGYISAFLTTTTDRFRAVSVGAGISDWMTYYVNTDIHPFTRHYLGATPWEDREIYDETSPIHYVRDASTPTLIQHGEDDARVPIPNAYELYQGLRDVGVDTRLVVYEGFGHGIDAPKELLAANWHNWQWIARWLWDEEVELPLEGGTGGR